MTTPKPIRIILIDDDLIYCKSLQMYFNSHPKIEIVRYFNRSDQITLELLKDIDFTYIILDLVMPNKSGIEMLESFQKWKIQSPIIVSTSYSDSSYNETLKTYGIKYCLQKCSPIEFSNQLNSLLDNTLNSTHTKNEIKLSEREIQLILLVNRGKKQTEIADELNLSKESIKKLKAVIAKKLGIENTPIAFFKIIKELGYNNSK